MGYHVLWREGLANIVKKTACPACGSHDNLVVYSDGGMHCFGIDCGYTVLGEEYKLEHGILDQVYEHEEGNKLMFQEKWERIKSKTVTEGGGFRGIRDDIYAKFGVRHEYHKVLQNGEETDELVAQYYPLTTTEGDDTQVCGVKVRSIPKKFHAEGTNKKDKTHLFGQVNFLNSLSKTVVLTSGECFPPEVEVFTDQGFKRFDALDKTELVLQVTEEGTEFVKPLAYVDKPYKGDLVHLSYSKFEVLCTPDHNLVYSKNGLVKIKAKDTPPGSAVFLSSVKATNPRLDRSDAEIVYHTLDYLCDLSTASHDTLVDVQDVLDSLGVKTHMETIMGKGSTLEVEDMGAPISPHLLSMAQREMVIEYVRNVSGASPRRLQELLCLSGESSVIINGKLFKALNNKASHTHTREMLSYEGRVYCVTVPSGMIMIRHNGKVGVVGNCDLLASYQMLFDALGNDQCPAVVSGTCGEGAVEQYSAQYDFLNRFEKIIIVPDADEAGRKALKRAVQTLPKDKVYVLDVPTVYKDPNAMLMAGKAKDFVTLYFRAKPYVPDGIVGSGQLYQNLIESTKRKKIPLPPFMSQLQDMLNGGFTLESIVNIAAASGLGKSTYVNEILYFMIFNAPYKVGIVSMELSAGQYANALFSRHVQKKLANMPDNLLEEYLQSDEAKAKGDELFKKDGTDRFYIIEDRSSKLDVMKDLIEELVIGCGCKVVVLDPIQDALSGCSLEEQDRFMTWQKVMVKTYEICFINVSHTRKAQNNKESGSLGNIPTEESMQGHSSLYKSASVNILLARNKMAENEVDRNTTEVFLSKNRNNGVTGPAGKIFYDNETHTLYDEEQFREIHPELFVEPEAPEEL